VTDDAGTHDSVPRIPSVDDFPESGVNALATFAQRAWARALDTVLVYVPLVIVAVTLAIDFEHPEEQIDLTEVTWLPFAWVVVAGLYETITVATWGATIGKVALGTRVARYADGERPTYEQALLRCLLPLAAGALVWVLFGSAIVGAMVVYLTALANDLGRGWHDQAGGTVVIRTR
jgi:uncharacterized RDD family membrane protein YckC